MSQPRRALISVSDKTSLDTFAQGLVELGFEILSTGGTAKYLRDAGIEVIDVSDYTQFPEIMGGRVKTLHPRVHGALLGRPDLDDHATAMKEHGIVPFELTVVNLYPFEETIAKDGVTIPEAIEQIDIGGPSMVRSSAKNHAYVGIVTSPTQYDRILEQLRGEGLTEAFRRELAGAAFEMTARYDRAISNYFAGLSTAEESQFPNSLSINLKKQGEDLRYGENPHQKAAFYVESPIPACSIAAAEQLNGKELSYNNLLDVDAAFAIAREFDEPAAAVIKHTNPCGCAVADSLALAFERAYAGDPVSAFGSIIAFNRKVDAQTAELMAEPGKFVEVVIAPDYGDDAFEILTTKPKWKNNVRLLKCPDMLNRDVTSFDYRRVSGGLLVQQRDDQPDPEDKYEVVTERQPSDDELHDLKFAWKVCKHVKSNAILLAKGGMVIGVGAGQMSRLDSSFIAAHKAGERSHGGVLASDAFFPFRDGVDEAAKAGVKAIIQPGGSRNDQQVIEACNEHGMTMIFTGRRHFKH